VLAEHVGTHDDNLENEDGRNKDLGGDFVADSAYKEYHGEGAYVCDDVLPLPSM